MLKINSNDGEEYRVLAIRQKKVILKKDGILYSVLLDDLDSEFSLKKSQKEWFFQNTRDLRHILYLTKHMRKVYEIYSSTLGGIIHTRDESVDINLGCFSQMSGREYWVHQIKLNGVFTIQKSVLSHEKIEFYNWKSN